MRLKDKAAIITGSGRGIGEGIVMRFAQEGAKIIVNDVNEADAMAVVEKVRAGGGQAVAVLGSVSDREVVQKMVDTAVAQFGTLDIIVNNAGITRDVMLHKMTDDQWKAVIDVNLTGVYYGIQCAGRVMREKKYGKIINTGSIHSSVAMSGLPLSAYCSTKGAVLMMTKALANEWAKYNITVNAIGPAYFPSEMTDAVVSDPAFMEIVKTYCPMQRTGREGELDGAVVYFASDASSYTTGQLLSIDGGWTAI